MKLLLFTLALLATPLQSAFAHPVAYKGAFALMTWNQPFLSDYWAVYSFLPNMAITARSMRMTMEQGNDFVLYLPQFDLLAKRWNGDDSQANIYVYGGFGGARFQGQNGSAGLVGIEIDAESRRYFGLLRYEGMVPSVGQVFQQTEARMGIAPYEAEYGELASWFMISAKYHPALARGYSITPMGRFFYKSVLWETGVSLQGDYMLNLMFHF